MGAFIKTLLFRVCGTSHTSPCCCVIPPDPGDLPDQRVEAALLNLFVGVYLKKLATGIESRLRTGAAVPHLHGTGCKVEPVLLAYRCIQK